MRDVLSDLEAWWRAGETVAVATVVSTWNSSPRQPGASMLIGPDGSVVGSVSGGCVEAAVYELATSSMASRVAVLQRYGVSDADAFAVGLTCGGTLDVFVQPVDRGSFPEFGEVAEALRAGEPVALALLLDGAEPGGRLVVSASRAKGSFGSPWLDEAVREDARAMLARDRTGTLRYGSDGVGAAGEMSVFVLSFAPRPRMIVFGAVDFAAAVARVGAFMGYRVTVCDARPTFATAKRFPDADEVVVDWPHRYLAATETNEHTVVCVLTHDPKFDLPLLQLALRMPLAYVGAMGSRRTNETRLKNLAEMGVTSDELSRLRAPIGLDLGSRTPAETAISIAAEIIQNRWGATGEPLTTSKGPIHKQLDPITGRM